MLQILHQQGARLVWLKKPLVCIQIHRIRPFDAFQQFLAALRYERESAISRIHMQPDALFRAEVGHRTQRVDRSRAGAPRIRAHHHGMKPPGAVFAHHAAQFGQVHTEIVAGADNPGILALNACDKRRLFQGAVTLIANVDGRKWRVPRRLPRRHQRFDACGRTAAGQHTAGAVGVSDPVSHPVHHHEFQLARSARGEPGGGVQVEARAKKIRDYARPCRGSRNETETSGMIQPRCKGKNFPRCLFEHVHCRSTLFGWRRTKLIFQHRTEFTVPGPLIPQPAGSVRQHFSRPARQAQHFLPVHLKTVSGIVLHFYLPRSF